MIFVKLNSSSAAKAIGASLLALVASSSAAFSQWVYNGEESAFGGAGVHLVVTAHKEYLFGFRCYEDETLALFVTPEHISEQDAAELSDLSPEFLIRVDDNDVDVELAYADRANEKLRLTREVPLKLLLQVRDAKRRVAVAFRVDDRVFHEQSFTARGSTSALRKFIANCFAAETN